MNSDIDLALKSIASDLLQRLGVEEATVRVQIEAGAAGDHFLVAIGMQNASRFIGHRGETMQHFQHLLRLIADAQIADESLDARRQVSVDIDGYRQSYLDSILEKAARSAEAVFGGGAPAKLPPLSAYARRAVHLMIADKFPELTTESLGRGLKKPVRIFRK